MTASATRDARTPTRSMLLAGLVASTPVVVVAPLLAWAAAGGWAAVSALLGGVVSVVIFVLGVIGIRGVLAGPTASTMAGAFGVFVLQMAILAVILWSLAQTTWLQVTALVIVFVVVGLVFQAGLIVGYSRSRSELAVTMPGEGR